MNMPPRSISCTPVAPLVARLCIPRLAPSLLIKKAPRRRCPSLYRDGYPNVTRGPGFLGAKHGYIYLTETEVGPAGLKRPDFINEYRAARRQQLLTTLRDEFQEQHKTDKTIENYTAASETGFSLAGPKFMNVFDLKSEATALRDKYGSEFGQRLLLSRRLVESGVRFIEVSSNLNFVNGTGWDTHNEGQQNQHLLIQELDQD